MSLSRMGVPKMTAPTPADVAAQAAPAQEQPKPEAPEIDWKAKAREWETKAKANKTAADELARLQEQQKTVEQKAAEREAAAEARAAEAERKATRREVALEFGMSADDAALLDDLADETSMRRLAERLGQKSEERIKQGNYAPGEGRTPNPPAPDDLQQFARSLFRRA